jgi:hypothetical protein
MALLLCGCGEHDDVGARRQLLAGGTFAPDQKSVVRVEYLHGNESIQCSGVLVAPNVVVTAAHCLTGQNTMVECGEPTSALTTTRPATGFRVTATADLQSTAPPPSAYWSVKSVALSSAEGSSLCGHDVGVLMLETAVALSVAKPLDVTFELPHQQSTFTAYGYGAGHSSGTGEGVRRELTDQAIECIGSSCDGFVISGVAGAGPVLAPAVDAKEFVGTDGACPGDSGGPALTDSSTVFAIVSRGHGDCSTPVYALLPTELRAVVRAAADEAGYDAPVWAVEPVSGSGGGSTNEPRAGGDAGAEGGGQPTPSRTSPSGCSFTPTRSPPSLPLGYVLLLGAWLFRSTNAKRAD